MGKQNRFNGFGEEIPVDTMKLSENAAAIFAGFHQYKDFEAAYAASKDRVGGFPGLWQVCAHAARVVTEQEAVGKLRFDEEKPQWIDFVDYLVEYLIEHMRKYGSAPMGSELESMVTRVAKNVGV